MKKKTIIIVIALIIALPALAIGSTLLFAFNSDSRIANELRYTAKQYVRIAENRTVDAIAELNAPDAPKDPIYLQSGVQCFQLTFGESEKGLPTYQLKQVDGRGGRTYAYGQNSAWCSDHAGNNFVAWNDDRDDDAKIMLASAETP